MNADVSKYIVAHRSISYNMLMEQRVPTYRVTEELSTLISREVWERRGQTGVGTILRHELETLPGHGIDRTMKVLLPVVQLE